MVLSRLATRCTSFQHSHCDVCMCSSHMRPWQLLVCQIRSGVCFCTKDMLTSSFTHQEFIPPKMCSVSHQNLLQVKLG